MNNSFGRYLPGKGFIYNFDPRAKIVVAILYLVLIFFVHHFIDMAVITIPIIFVYIFTYKKVIPLLSLMRFPALIAGIIFLVNIYVIRENDVHESKYHADLFLAFTKFKENNFGISILSLNKSIAIFWRIYIMILITTILTNSTRPVLLTKAIEDIIWPLKFVFVPVHIIAMIITIALRFIPTMLDEAKRIMKAQSSRGIDFKNGHFNEKTTAFTTLVIPLFVSSFAKAEDLSNAMDTRGYDPYGKRTKYRELKFKFLDFVILFALLLLFTFVIVNMFNPGGYLPSWYLSTIIK
ncbi:energy-coupling factor transporter transmembrane component T family protein [Mycoplasmopsis synoviae]|uniref:energy-coupling factor transporter transmembrane component T family protein n=1 Tax=Mycoplasmopsis synoviae TaxID=2109 RepID=UPI00349EB87D